ncbi:MAG: fibrobacter succinogenes major paralogous domain-containing protein [Bacteroidales bacterium]
MLMEAETFIDPLDGRVYKTVKLGTQVWLAENLNADKYRNGDPVLNRKGKGEWGKHETGAWCFYDNEKKNGEIYGRLYNWFAVNDPRGLAPEGWHIPTDEEWKELEIYLGLGETEAGYRGWRGQDTGGKLKETGTSHWHEPNEKATNASGFTALPGGYRDVDGHFYVLGYGGYWWSSSEHTDDIVWYRSLYHTYSKIHRTDSYAGDGFSVRCVKDS